LFPGNYCSAVEVCGIENIGVDVIGSDPAGTTTEKFHPP